MVYRERTNMKAIPGMIAAAVLGISSAWADGELRVLFSDMKTMDMPSFVAGEEHREAMEFSVPIVDGKGERPFDFTLEYPIEFNDDGEPTQFEKTGLGYYISVEVLEETEDAATCKVDFQYRRLGNMLAYSIGERIVLLPEFKAFNTDTTLSFFPDSWISLGAATPDGGELKLMYLPAKAP